MGKKKWKVPKIKILVRMKPDEAVMLSCKWFNVNGQYFGGCEQWGPGPCSCEQNLTAS